jgi:hypothetical protein
MTREDIMRMAREAWLMDKHDCSDDWFVRADIDEKNIFEFAALVAAAEREACAELAGPSEEHRRDASWGYAGGEGGVELLDSVAAAIRARGEI